LDLSKSEQADQPKKSAQAKALTMKKAGITALKVSYGSSIDNKPWVNEVTFLYDSGTERYAVVGTVEHRLVENQRAFFSFKVDRISKQ
jgi:hypothetical protein